MITWGIVANSHDASLAVANTSSSGTNILWAGLAKDFSGVPNDPHLNQGLLEYASFFGEPEQVIWYERPLLKTFRQVSAGQGLKYFKENNVKKYLANYNIRPPKGIKYVQHHKNHAAYAYYTQPYDNCAVICLDSIGEFETLTIWHGKNGKLRKLHSQGYPHSLGLFYSAMTQRMGFTPQRDEYLVAQHAQAGDPLKLMQPMLDEIIDIPLEGNHCKIKMRQNLHRGCMWWRPELKTVQDMADIAAATQACFELSVKTLSNWTKWKTGSSNLALAGGGAMNRDAVNKIKSDWDNIWVPPNPGDPGSSVGCILAANESRIDNIANLWHK